MIPNEKQRVYLYKEYLQFPEDIRYELIEGIPYLMSSPSIRHQTVLGNLHLIFSNYFKDSKCKVFIAPCDVLLNEINEIEDDVKNVVQPDLFVICDKTKINEQNCIGSPDIIIEIISPSNISNDAVKKLALYEKHQVKEYWIVDPIKNRILVYTLEESQYGMPEIFTEVNNMFIISNLYLDLIINMCDIFKF